jgi:hypothetical protein
MEVREGSAQLGFGSGIAGPSLVCRGEEVNHAVFAFVYEHPVLSRPLSFHIPSSKPVLFGFLQDGRYREPSELCSVPVAARA